MTFQSKRYVWLSKHLDIACEDDHILGIFSTEQKAKEALKQAGHPDNTPWKMELDNTEFEDTG